MRYLFFGFPVFSGFLPFGGLGFGLFCCFGFGNGLVTFLSMFGGNLVFAVCWRVGIIQIFVLSWVLAWIWWFYSLVIAWICVFLLAFSCSFCDLLFLGFLDFGYFLVLMFEFWVCDYGLGVGFVVSLGL